MNADRTYRNRVNGAVGVYPERLARAFPNLELVEDDAKPLAYVPITPEAVEQVRADSAVEEPAPAPKPSTARKGR